MHVKIKKYTTDNKTLDSHSSINDKHNLFIKRAFRGEKKRETIILRYLVQYRNT